MTRTPGYQNWRSSLPTFLTPGELRRAPAWHLYLTSVYGDLPAQAFPIRLREFNFFFRSGLPVSIPKVPLLGLSSEIHSFILDGMDEITAVRHRHGPFTGRRWGDLYQLLPAAGGSHIETALPFLAIWIYAHQKGSDRPSLIGEPSFPGTAGFKSNSLVEVMSFVEDGEGSRVPGEIGFAHKG